MQCFRTLSRSRALDRRYDAIAIWDITGPLHSSIKSASCSKMLEGCTGSRESWMRTKRCRYVDARRGAALEFCSIMKRILIADDHETVRSGLRAVLEGRAGWEVVAEARDGKEAVARAVEKRPDVAIIDYGMPFMTGVEVARRIREHQLITEILIFTMHDSEVLALQAFRAGARAFLLKSDANKMLLAAVESLIVHRPFYAGSFSSELRGMATGKGDPNEPLSPREKTIVKLVAEGHSNKGVSAILNLSIKTTETHRAAAMRKLNINSTAGLVRYAVRKQARGGMRTGFEKKKSTIRILIHRISGFCGINARQADQYET